MTEFLKQKWEYTARFTFVLKIELSLSYSDFVNIFKTEQEKLTLCVLLFNNFQVLKQTLLISLWGIWWPTTKHLDNIDYCFHYSAPAPHTANVCDKVQNPLQRTTSIASRQPLRSYGVIKLTLFSTTLVLLGGESAP